MTTGGEFCFVELNQLNFPCRSCFRRNKHTYYFLFCNKILTIFVMMNKIILVWFVFLGLLLFYVWSLASAATIPKNKPGCVDQLIRINDTIYLIKNCDTIYFETFKNYNHERISTYLPDGDAVTGRSRKPFVTYKRH